MSHFKDEKSPYSICFLASDLYPEVQLDIFTAPITSLGGSQYVAHFLEPNAAKSDIALLKQKSKLKDNFKYYIASVETQFSQFGCQISRIWCNKAGETIPEGVVEYYRSHGVESGHFLPYFLKVTELLNVLFMSIGILPLFLFLSAELPDFLFGDAMFHSG